VSVWAAVLSRMTEVIRDTFPAPVVYDPDGAAYTLTGVFDESYKAVDVTEAGFPVDSTEPRLTLRLADLPVTPKTGDNLTVSGRLWEVSGVEPDGSGMVGLRLLEVV